jgi:hypothetical protein
MAKGLDSKYVPKAGESKGSTAGSLSRVLMAMEKKAKQTKLGSGGAGECARKGMHN